MLWSMSGMLAHEQIRAHASVILDTWFRCSARRFSTDGCGVLRMGLGVLES